MCPSLPLLTKCIGVGGDGAKLYISGLLSYFFSYISAGGNWVRCEERPPPGEIEESIPGSYVKSPSHSTRMGWGFGFIHEVRLV